MRKIFRIIFAAVALSLSWVAVAQNSSKALSEADYNPVAKPQAVVVQGNARFTVLTSRLIRMEWSQDGKWEDNATLAIVNRDLDVPAFKVSKSSSKLVIKTADLTLTYTGKAKFDEKNLSVVFPMDVPGAKKPRMVTWRPGADQSANLMGTCRTLDGCQGPHKINYNDPMELGILSRDGWAIVDESERHLIVKDDSDWGAWVAPREGGERQDMYIFAYGHDYLAALKDFTKVAGRVPMPPKYMFGYWWCRYWQYSDFEFVGLAKDIKARNIPIDVMVIDMDWHETWSLCKKDAPKDEFGQRIGWTGYTWQKQLFPDPQNFLTDLKDMNLRTSLNLHPASGIQPYEDCYDRFVKDYLGRVSEYDGPEGYVYKEGGYTFKGNAAPCGAAGEKAPVPFRICDKDWTNAYFNSVIHPLENQGVDFWWLDWQQWKQSKYMDGLSNTFWLNFTFFNDKARQSVSQGIYASRPVIYHRWGGLGSHRYQIGFSGDTQDNWEVLGWLPYFTATASNVCYGYWGHDIGGHMQAKAHYTDAEIYTRWLQYGVFTPIFKTHSTKTRFLEKRFWAFPEHYDYMVEAIRLRYDLSPYIYTAVRQAYDEGVSMCRPLYYYYPEVDNAYSRGDEFMFGDRILATSIGTPVDGQTSLATKNLWFPEGDDWYDMATGNMYKGGSVKDLHYTVAENPWFVKAGSVLPLAGENISSLQEQDPALRVLVVPGNGDSEFT
ncbi:MAG: glycosyl hydrolase family 31, partial [Bacteroidales bacterium]|nr:glycosyl hydrolase family 31 [Bacteroidales bacterium]